MSLSPVHNCPASSLFDTLVWPPPTTPNRTKKYLQVLFKSTPKLLLELKLLQALEVTWARFNLQFEGPFDGTINGLLKMIVRPKCFNFLSILLLGLVRYVQ